MKGTDVTTIVDAVYFWELQQAQAARSRALYSACVAYHKEFLANPSTTHVKRPLVKMVLRHGRKLRPIGIGEATKLVRVTPERLHSPADGKRPLFFLRATRGRLHLFVSYPRLRYVEKISWPHLLDMSDGVDLMTYLEEDLGLVSRQ